MNSVDTSVTMLIADLLIQIKYLPLVELQLKFQKQTNLMYLKFRI